MPYANNQCSEQTHDCKSTQSDHGLLILFTLLKKEVPYIAGIFFGIQGPVVQSVVSLTSSLRVISLTVLADSIHNILIFFAEKM